MTDHSAQHTNAVKQLAESRDRAMESVNLVRQDTPATAAQNLVSDPPGDKEVYLVKANQAVAEYLLQLHPYRRQSQHWGADLGAVSIPESVTGESPNRRGLGSNGVAPRYRCCRQPSFRFGSLSDVISAINKSVTYSANYAPDDVSDMGPDGTEIRLPQGTVRVQTSTASSWLSGDLTTNEVIERAGLEQQAQQPNRFTPADPPRSEEHSKRFKFVFRPDVLLTLVEKADEVAAEMDMLADIEEQSRRDSEGL